MKIRLLCENTAADMVWLAEWGFSALIEFAYQVKFHNAFGCKKYGAGDVIEV